MGSRALRNTVLVLAAKVVARLIALVTVIATLKQLMPAPYGTFITLVNYTAIVSVVAAAALSTLRRLKSIVRKFGGCMQPVRSHMDYSLRCDGCCIGMGRSRSGTLRRARLPIVRRCLCAMRPSRL